MSYEWPVLMALVGWADIRLARHEAGGTSYRLTVIDRKGMAILSDEFYPSLPEGDAAFRESFTEYKKLIFGEGSL